MKRGCDKRDELKDNGYPELAEKLDAIKRQIGDLFNAFGSHEFDLPGTDCDKPRSVATLSTGTEIEIFD